MELLFTVEFSVFLEGIGNIIAASCPKDAGFPKLSLNDKILLRSPNNEELETYVQGFPMLNFKTQANSLHYSVVIPKDVEIDKFFEGTNVYKVSNTQN